MSDEDGDNLTLYAEYLLNTDPGQSNQFRVVESQWMPGGQPSVKWMSLGGPNGTVNVGVGAALVPESWPPASGSVSHAGGLTTWTGDAAVTTPAGFIRVEVRE